MAQLRRQKSEFEKRGVRIVAISPVDGASAESVCGMLNVPYTCLGDPSGEAYEAYGLGRGGFWKILNIHTLFRGMLAFFGGHRQGRPMGDRFRLPGAFIIDSNGRTVWAWRGRDAAGHASALDLLSALDKTKPA
ncbi:MAG: AhpC/TSA family protein [bacterium]